MQEGIQLSLKAQHEERTCFTAVVALVLEGCTAANGKRMLFFRTIHGSLKDDILVYIILRTSLYFGMYIIHIYIRVNMKINARRALGCVVWTVRHFWLLKKKKWCVGVCVSRWKNVQYHIGNSCADWWPSSLYFSSAKWRGRRECVAYLCKLDIPYEYCFISFFQFYWSTCSTERERERHASYHIRIGCFVFVSWLLLCPLL